MKTNLDGFDELRRRAEAIDGENIVPATELFTAAFMRQYTDFQSLQDMLDQMERESGLQDLEEIVSSEQWGRFVAAHTRFSSWQGMIDAASNAWVKGKLGF